MQSEELIEAALNLAPADFDDWLAQRGQQFIDQNVAALKAKAEEINDDGRLRDALALLDRAAQVAQVSSNPTSMGLVWRGRANVLQMAERFEESLAAANQAAEIYRQHGTPLDVAVARTVEVVVLGALERFDEAIALAHDIRHIFEEADFDKGLAFLAANLGKVYTMAWQLELALREYRQARSLFVKLDMSSLAAEVLHNMGVAAYYLDRLDLARRYYTKSYLDLVAAGDLHTAIKAQFNLAQLCEREGKFEQALQHLAQARDDVARLPDSPDSAYVGLFEGQVRQALGQREQAQALFRQAVMRFDQLGRRLESAQAWMALGHLLARSTASEQVQEGLLCLEEAEVRTQSFDVPLLRGWLWLSQAECLLTLDRAFEASTRARAAGELFVKAELRLRHAHTNVVLADCYWRLQPQEARHLYLAALEASSGKDLLIAARCWRGLGRLAATERNIDDAERFYDQAIALLDEVRRGLHGHAHQSGFMEDKHTLAEEMLATLTDRGGNGPQILRWVERLKAQALADLLLAQPLDPSVDAELGRLLGMRRQLRDQYDSTVQQSMGTGELLANLAQQRGPAIAAHDAYQELKTSELTRQMQLLDEKIATYQHPAIAWRDGVTDHRSIPGDLVGDRTLLVSYYSVRGRLCVLTAKGDLQDIQAHALQVGIGELEAQLQRTHRLISRPDSSLGDLQTHLGRLWTSLIAPIESRLSDCEHIVILPYRGLFRVPFSALFDLRTRQYLIERWSVQTVPSAAVLAHCRTRTRGARPPLLVGYPGDPTDADYLPGVTKEVHLLHGALKHADVLLAEQATPDQVMAQISGRSLIHLACHAIFDQRDPLMSGLRLAKGRWLRAADLYQHYGVIEGSTVVLSGCSTSQGRPTGQDILGMVSALLYAGASCVVAGLWRIDDTATVELMNTFYREFMRNGSVVSALQQAQQTLLLSSSHPHPYFWAPFVSTGDATRPLSPTQE